eukprot:Pompholyxophrys_punicea_v1_NODE_28_length_5163_cov_5.731206.p7 type:complete len:140 gc:universal NODE_28_length_5163_cov_5.731206:1111-692(-)
MWEDAPESTNQMLSGILSSLTESLVKRQIPLSLSLPLWCPMLALSPAPSALGLPLFLAQQNLSMCPGLLHQLHLPATFGPFCSLLYWLPPAPPLPLGQSTALWPNLPHLLHLPLNITRAAPFSSSSSSSASWPKLVCLL